MTGRRGADGGRAGVGAGVEALGEAAEEALLAFAEHLRSERGCSPHTVRAYVADVRDLLHHAASAGAPARAPAGALAALDLHAVRGWLADGSGRGLARSTLAHR
ncbi:site-specific integrase, partial [Kineococcus glutinatus]|uniref:site-specific integrase n=1 Tax=Kineococcus glutinatus TaxID=1070872 RepID=UPI0031EE51DD